VGAYSSTWRNRGGRFSRSTSMPASRRRTASVARDRIRSCRPSSCSAPRAEGQVPVKEHGGGRILGQGFSEPDAASSASPRARSVPYEDHLSGTTRCAHGWASWQEACRQRPDHDLPRADDRRRATHDVRVSIPLDNHGRLRKTIHVNRWQRCTHGDGRARPRVRSPEPDAERRNDGYARGRAAKGNPEDSSPLGSPSDTASRQ
jgi:hypothetical protein